jgi:hypothetical protein
MENVITDPTFDLKKTEEYSLSIQVSLDGFYFSIIQSNENRLVALDHYSATISSEIFLARRFKEWYDNQNLIHQKFADTRILYLTEKFTLIPGELYNYEKQHKVADLLFKTEEGTVILDNYIPEIEGNLLFAVPKTLSEEFSTKLPGRRLNHPVTLLIPKIMETAAENENTLMLFFDKACFFLLLFKNNKLHIANSFKFLHPEDVVYYVLSVLNQTGTKLKEIIPYAAGEIGLGDHIHTRLKDFFSNLTFFPPQVNFDAEVFKESMHRFIALY